MSEQEHLARPGRPRDTGITERVLSTATILFGERGWAGFTIDRVAAESGVGKSAIYRRWESKEDLLVAALSAYIVAVEDVDTGSLGGDLLAFARQIMGLYIGPYGLATRRLSAEPDFTPALRGRLDEFFDSQVKTARQLVRRAVDRGYVDHPLPTTLILNIINGASMSYSITTPGDVITPEHADTYATRLVNFVLAALDVSTTSNGI